MKTLVARWQSYCFILGSYTRNINLGPNILVVPFQLKISYLSMTNDKPIFKLLNQTLRSYIPQFQICLYRSPAHTYLMRLFNCNTLGTRGLLSSVFKAENTHYEASIFIFTLLLLFSPMPVLLNTIQTMF